MSNKKDKQSSHSELFDLIGELAQRRFRMAERSLVVLGLNHSEARLVSVLAEEGTMTQDALSASLTVDRSNAGRSLKKLEGRGYIVRHKDEIDKRTNLVAITDEGRGVAEHVGDIRDNLVEMLLGNLTAEDTREVVHRLRKVLSKPSN